jgi:hypothetical protein
MIGGCLCGAVRYRYEGPLGGELGTITLCHCRTCRRAQGYAAAAVPALAAGFAFTAGADQVREYESSPGKKRAFCGVCGASLYSRRDNAPDAIRLRIGSLDDPPPNVRIQAHIHVAGAPAWTERDDAPRYPGEEPGRGLAPGAATV